MYKFSYFGEIGPNLIQGFLLRNFLNHKSTAQKTTINSKSSVSLSGVCMFANERFGVFLIIFNPNNSTKSNRKAMPPGWYLIGTSQSMGMFLLFALMIKLFVQAFRKAFSTLGLI